MWIIYNLSQKRRNVCRWLQSIRGIGQKEGTKMFTALDAWRKPARTAIEPQRQNLTLQQSIGLIKLSCCKRKLSRNNHQLQVWSCDSAHTCLHITSVCFRDEPLTSCSESHGLRNEPFTQKQVRTVNTTKSWLIRTSKTSDPVQHQHSSVFEIYLQSKRCRAEEVQCTCRSSAVLCSERKTTRHISSIY